MSGYYFLYRSEMRGFIYFVLTFRLLNYYFFNYVKWVYVKIIVKIFSLKFV